VSHLINAYVAHYRYCVYRLEPDPNGKVYRVELTNLDGKRPISLTIYQQDFEETVKNGKLAEAVRRYLDSELGEPQRAGRMGRGTK